MYIMYIKVNVDVPQTRPLYAPFPTSSLSLALYMCHPNTINPIQLSRPASVATSKAHCNNMHTDRYAYTSHELFVRILIGAVPPFLLFL